MKRRNRRGVSLGTVVMLSLSCLVLAGFFSLLPRLTGQPDVRVNASEIAVAFDESISQISTVTKKISKAVSEPVIAPFATQDSSTPVPTVEATATPAPKYSFTLCASGSLKFNSAVQKALTDETGYHYDMVLEQLTTFLASDLTIATLENSVIPTAKLTDTNQPAELLTALKQAGIDALNLGHYAVLDSGIEGLKTTKQSITDKGMLPYGAYASRQERDQLVLTNVNGVTVALLSYQSDLSSASKKKTSAEEQDYAVAKLQLPVISADISAARSNGAQVIIVSLCWGKSNSASPTDTQKELAQGIANAGADVILGTRSEAVQTVAMLTANRGDDKYHPVLCAYNLGNLFTHNREKRASLAGVLLQTTIQYDMATGLVAFDDLAYTPTYCWRGKENGVQRYRVLNSAASQQPDYVDKDQQAISERCFSSISDMMSVSGFALKP